MLHVETCIERWRGTLRKYFEETKEEIFEEIKQTNVPVRTVNKILWWDLKFIFKTGAVTNFWKTRRSYKSIVIDT